MGPGSSMFNEVSVDYSRRIPGSTNVHTAFARGGEWMVLSIHGIIRHRYRYTHMDTDIVLV